jgi:hypothetical protein
MLRLIADLQDMDKLKERLSNAIAVTDHEDISSELPLCTFSFFCDLFALHGRNESERQIDDHWSPAILDLDEGQLCCPFETRMLQYGFDKDLTIQFRRLR